MNDIGTWSKMKAITVAGFLLLSMLGFGVIVIFGANADAPTFPVAADEVSTGKGSRSLSTRAGEDYLELSDVDYFMPDGTELLDPDFVVGGKNYQLDIWLDINANNFVDDDNETNGDNVAYNVSVQLNGVTDIDGNTVTNPLSYDVGTFQPSDLDDQRLTESTKTVADFYNSAGTDEYLDSDNDGGLETGEVDQVTGGAKLFDTFQFDVNNNAEPGEYILTVDITYDYQTYQPFAENPNGLQTGNLFQDADLVTGDGIDHSGLGRFF